MAKVFISYSHDDETWKDLLQSHLSVLEKQGRLEIWDDRQIQTGDDWFPEIETALNNSHIAILLISRHFLTSDFILGKEVPILLQRRVSEGLRVIPLILAPCAWETVDWLKAIQGYPKDNQPLSGMSEHEIEEQLAALVLKIDHTSPLNHKDDPIQTNWSLPPEKIQVSKLPHTNAGLFGRETELESLDQAWGSGKTNILILKAMGGTGKTALMKHWLDALATDHFHGANAVYTWSFYSQGTTEDKQASADEFFETALRWFGYQGDPPPFAHDKGLKLAELVNNQCTLLILDGLEPLQYPEGGAMDGMLRDQGLTTLLQQLAAQNQGLLLISSRQALIELKDKPKPRMIHHDLENLSISAGRQLFKAAHITGTDQEFEDTVNEYKGHALSLNLLATY